jgi:hypothetical protein
MAKWVKASIDNYPVNYVNLDLQTFLVIVPGGEPIEWSIRCNQGLIGTYATEDEAVTALAELIGP